MKKKLLSFFALAAFAIVTFAAAQALRAAADDAHILWSSETPVAADWGSDAIKVTADKLEALKVGDILHVVITGVTPGDQWSAQVAIKDGTWANLDAGVGVGTGDITDVSFLLTGDILSAIKATGLIVSGNNYSATQVYYEDGTLTGSEKSIWIGSETGKPTVSSQHFTNVKAGDIIRVTASAIDGFESDTWFILTYSGSDTSWSWVNYDGMPGTKTASGFDFVVNEANVNQIKTDGIILNQAGYTITQVELLESYEVTIGEGITGGTVSVDKAIAAEGDEVTITATPNEGYKVKSYSVTGVNTNLAVTVNNGKFKMPADAVTVSVTFNQSVDVAISPASGDISEALNAAIAELGNNDAKNITINLAENATYTISAPIVAPASVTINGNGATIDASALEGNFIQMAAIEASSAWTEANVTVKGITVKGLKKALFYSGCKQYFGDVVVDNCVVELAADVTTFDYTKGSTAVNFTVTNSTFYAPTATTKSFYSSQSGQKTTEYNAEAIQTFKFEKNTMYNLAKGKNFFTHRQNSQKWLKFVAKNNIFVDCGKSGQTIKGMNGGGSSANPIWDIDGNVFNFGGADTGASEATGDDAEPVKNSVAGVVIFKDATNGDFDGKFMLAIGADAPAKMPGDQRWVLTVATSQTVTTAASGYTTLVSVYPLDFTTAAGLTAYVVAADEDIDIANSKVKLTQVTEAAANTPVILLGTANTEYTITVKADAAAVTGNLLKGSATTATTLNADEAYLLKDGKFGLCTDGKLPAGKAYLPVPAGSASNELIIVIDGDVTGIDKVVTRDALENAKIYNLQGQEVKKAGKGIYIINGKKVVMK